MKKHNLKSDLLKVDYDGIFNIIGTPKFIIRFDVVYVLALILFPFLLSLSNWWYFSKITPNQMLSYVGSMTSAFCTINLALLTYSFNLSIKRENDYLKKRTFAFLNIGDFIKINIYDEEQLILDVPLKIKTDNLYGNIKYEVRSIALLGVGINIQLIYDPDEIRTLSSGKNIDTPQINISALSKKISLLSNKSRNNITHMTLQIIINNDGVITPNPLIIGVKKEPRDGDRFEITYVLPV